MKTFVSQILIACTLTTGSLSCSSSHNHEHEGNPSGSTCPPNSTLTYETFGRSFMNTYCTHCHSSTLTGESRKGAPSDHNFDSLSGIRATDLSHIDQMAAAGPSHINTSMPPDTAPSKPSEDERRQLGQWIACGAP